MIGNLTRDPELRYTPQGTAVCTFGLATNRGWVTDAGEKKEEAEFHKIVAWNKLAEICSQLLGKGKRVYIEGRLATRSWTGQDGANRQTTEVVASDMIILDSRGAVGEISDLVPSGGVEGSQEESTQTAKEDAGEEVVFDQPTADSTKKNKGKSKKNDAVQGQTEENGEDMPF